MDNLTAYIFQHYSHLLTPTEREAHFGMGLFDVNGPFGPKPRSVASRSHDKQVRELASLGVVEFRRRVVERILREHASEAILNGCPKCAGLCRTPRARQCFRCGHDWHEPKPA